MAQARRTGGSPSIAGDGAGAAALSGMTWFIALQTALANRPAEGSSRARPVRADDAGLAADEQIGKVFHVRRIRRRW